MKRRHSLIANEPFGSALKQYAKSTDVQKGPAETQPAPLYRFLQLMYCFWNS
jgi:hypothetical protein